MITVNGKTYKGNSISVLNDRVFIDGKEVDDKGNSKTINIKVEGNIDTLEVDYCDELDIKGNCKNVTSKNGNIGIKGDVDGDITSKNGDIICRNVTGSVETKNGDIYHK